MEKENKELKKKIRSLESELEASMVREEMLRATPATSEVGLKQKFYQTRIGRIAQDPNSKVGKIIRMPRTLYRIIRNPDVRREVFKTQQDQSERVESNIFAPIRFFASDCDEKRVNVVTEKFEPEILKMGVDIARKQGAKLRVITCGEGVATLKYREMVKRGEIKEFKGISFYSSYDQSLKGKVFELEVGEGEVFLTKVWQNEK